MSIVPDGFKVFPGGYTGRFASVKLGMVQDVSEFSSIVSGFDGQTLLLWFSALASTAAIHQHQGDGSSAAECREWYAVVAAELERRLL